MAHKPHLLNYQRARLCAIRSETEMVILTAAVTAEIVVRAEGEYNLEIEETIPVFWLSETDRVLAVGTEDWDEVIKRVGFGLVAISFADWTEENLLTTLRVVFPAIIPAGAGNR